jgi:hypothetical protein
LIGLTDTALAIYPPQADASKRAAKRQQWLHEQRRQLKKKIEENFNLKSKKIIPADSNEMPWHAVHGGD